MGNAHGVSGPLAGLLILVVEDDSVIARAWSATLLDAGAAVLGPCSNARLAMAALERDNPHCAVLDLHLSDGIKFGVAAVLHASRIPIIYATGYGASIIPPHLSGSSIILQKPVNPAALVEAVVRLLHA